MSDLRLVEETVAQIFASESEPWESFESVGLNVAGVPAEGGGKAESAVVARLAGRYAIAEPVMETAYLAAPILDDSGLPVPSGRLTIATGPSISGLEGRVTGIARNVPWASGSDHIIVVDDGFVACVPRRGVEIEPGVNLAGESRDDVTFRDVVVPIARSTWTREALRRQAALGRSLCVVGALHAVRDLTLEHVTQRSQFGRTLSRFQVVQHDVALMLAEVVAAEAATDAAVARNDLIATAAAKVRTGDAATRVAAIAHQLHGAMGITQEHALSRYTLRLWAWRDEYGNEREWARELGLAVVGSRAGLWVQLTETGL
jgi:acyl-CoA dehydrogenase